MCYDAVPKQSWIITKRRANTFLWLSSFRGLRWENILSLYKWLRLLSYCDWFLIISSDWLIFSKDARAARSFESIGHAYNICLIKFGKRSALSNWASHLLCWIYAQQESMHDIQGLFMVKQKSETISIVHEFRLDQPPRQRPPNCPMEPLRRI